MDMDLTPPPSQCPASPPNSCSSVEIPPSPIDYPSPALYAQQCRLSSLYGGTEPACAMTPPLDSDPPLTTLDAMSRPDWNHTTAIHTPTTSAGLPSVLTSEFDPFGGYGPSVPASFATALYPPAPPLAPKLPGQPVSNTGPIPLSRSPLSYSGPAMSVPGSSMGPRVKTETPIPDYSQLEDVPQFTQSRPTQSRYHIEPTAMYATGGGAGMSSGYLSDNTPVVWGPPAPDQFYPATAPASTNTPTTLNRPHHSQQPPLPALTPERQLRASRQPRRVPRRLTTKEEANYQCEVKGCGKLFSRSYNYKAHMETHDEKREYPFPCLVPDCNKKFVRKTDLQRHHQSVHMKERNHKCDYCGRLFARKDTLRRHMDDGCSKRFDLGTLDLRTEGYTTGGSAAQDSLWQVR